MKLFNDRLSSYNTISGNLLLALKNFFKGGFVETTFVGSRVIFKRGGPLDVVISLWIFCYIPVYGVIVGNHISKLYGDNPPDLIAVMISVVSYFFCIVLNTGTAQSALRDAGYSGALWAIMQKYGLDKNQVVFFSSRTIGNKVSTMFLSGKGVEEQQFKPIHGHFTTFEFFIHDNKEVVFTKPSGVLDKGILMSRINKKALQTMIDNHTFPLEEILNEIGDSAQGKSG